MEVLFLRQVNNIAYSRLLSIRNNIKIVEAFTTKDIIPLPPHIDNTTFRILKYKK